jgi:hypothetical protein
MTNFYIYINIKVNKILHKVNLYKVSQYISNLSSQHEGNVAVNVILYHFSFFHKIYSFDSYKRMDTTET